METVDLSLFFQTKAQANEFSTRLSLISGKIYNTNFDLEKILLDQFGLKKKDAFISLLRENGIDTKNNSELKKFFSSIIESIAKLPIMSLTIAFEPKEKTLQKLSEWFVMNVNKQAVFDIIVNPELLGGAAIDFNGKHMDFSIRPKFEEIIADVLEPKSSKEEMLTSAPLHQEAEHLSI
jgi:F0F1-type ATP synthase delta subunit